jgi:hypothetical protein
MARAHASSGDRIAIAAYLGGSDVFDQAPPGGAEPGPDQSGPYAQGLGQRPGAPWSWLRLGH